MQKNNNSVTRRVLIAIILLVIGILFLLHHFFYSDFSFTVLSYELPKNTISNLLDKELFKGDTVKGKFIAPDNYLGIVSIRFNTFKRENKDFILFRIKETNAPEWYFSESYRTTFSDGTFYNFGFAPIQDSKNKQYQFEITSLQGQAGNAIGISSDEPIIRTKHQYPKQILLSDKKLFISHIFKKIVALLFDPETIFVIFVIFSPFYIYLLLLNKNIQSLDQKYQIFLWLYVLLGVWNVLWIDRIIDKVLIMAMIVIAYVYRSGINNAKTMFVIVTLFLLESIIFYNYDYQASVRSASWAFIFLVLCIFFILQENYKLKK